jgi:hypothetical protein
VPRRWVFRPISSLNVSPRPDEVGELRQRSRGVQAFGHHRPPLSFRFAIWSRGRTCFSPTTPHREGPRRRFAAQESGKRLAVFYRDHRGLVAPGKQLRGIERRLVRTRAVLLRRNRREVGIELTANTVPEITGRAGRGGVKKPCGPRS